MEIELQQPIKTGEVHHVFLSSIADNYASTVDYIADENVLIHISFRPAEGVIVVNDRIDGKWRDEIRIALPRAYITLAANFRIGFETGTAAMTFSDADTTLFRRQTDFAEVTTVRSNVYLELNSQYHEKPAAQRQAKTPAVPSKASVGRRKASAAAEPSEAGERLHSAELDFDIPAFQAPVLTFALAATTDIMAQSVVQVSYWDRHGGAIRQPPHGFTAVGPGVSEKRKDINPQQTSPEEVPLVPPYGAVKGQVRITTTAPQSAILIDRPTVNFRDSCVSYNGQADAEATPGADARSGVPVIYSTSAGPYRSDVLRLRPHYLAENFGRLGFAVTYFPLSNTIPSPEAAPGVVQLRRSDFFLHVQQVLTRNDPPGVFVCSSLCDAQTVLLLDRIKERGWKVLYEVRDDPEGMKAAGAGHGKWYNPHLEGRMCRLADAVVTVSGPLRDRAIAFGADEANVHVLPNGLEEEAFVHAHRSWSAQALGERAARRTKVGYFGHMFSGRFDVEAVAQAAKELPEVQFELVGPGLHDPAMLSAPNITLFGQRSIDEFYQISSSWDVGLLPFKMNRITFSLDPIKYYQYLAAGLKSVNSDVHNLRGAPFTFPYSADRSLASLVRRALATPVTAQDAEMVRDYLSQATWELRTSETLRYLGYNIARVSNPQ